MRETMLTRLCRAAIVAAVYAALTIILYPISFGTVQIRAAEALCLLPMLFPETALGLFVGCLLSNLVSGNPLDIIFGSLATLVAALITTKIKNKWLAPLPAIVINGAVVGCVLTATTVANASFLQYLLWCGSIMAGEGIALYLFGIPLVSIIEKRRHYARWL